MRFIHLAVLCCALGGTSARAEDCAFYASEKAAAMPPGLVTLAPSSALPNPPVNNDCGFYKAMWHRFLYSTQPDATGEPAFWSYPKLPSVFPSAYPAGTAAPLLLARGKEPILNAAGLVAHSAAAVDGVEDLNQAAEVGLGGVLADANRNPVFYSLVVNDKYAGFVRDTDGLADPRALLSLAGAVPLSPDLAFPMGAVEFKAAWMIAEGDPALYRDYFIVPATVPTFKTMQAGARTLLVIDPDKPARPVKLALLALHVAEALDGHPEFVWATFEHADATGRRNVGPTATGNPGDPDPPVIDAGAGPYPLFGQNVAPGGVNHPASPAQFDVATQKFAAPSPVYRVFPGSAPAKPDDGDARAPFEDPAVFTLNLHVGEIFAALDPNGQDPRRHYRMVAAVWINDPSGAATHTAPNFTVNQPFGDDDPTLAGETRLSNLAVESFTQQSAVHCFVCHDTTEQTQLLGSHSIAARKINVSHIFNIVARKYLQSHPNP